MRTLVLGVSLTTCFVLLGAACGSSSSGSSGSGSPTGAGAGASGGAGGSGGGTSASVGGSGTSAGGTSTSAGGTSSVGGTTSAGGTATSAGGSPGAGGALAGPGGMGLGAGGVGGHESPMCDAYIACEGATTPQGLAVILAAYGKTGSCWDQGNPKLCDDACHAGIVAAHQQFPKEDTCNVCTAQKDCPSSLPACDTANSRCVTCLVNTDCKDPKFPACDVPTQSCVTCTQNFDCKSPNAHVCDAPSHVCVGCLTNTDCTDSFATVCDVGTNQCRGCKTGPECPSGICSSGNCVQCMTDAQCTDPTPHCFDNGKCVQCLDDSDCTVGGCDTLIGFCCGANACKNQGLECGTAFDLIKCGLTGIPCGDCMDGKACVENHCVVPPANTCKMQSCPSGSCGYVPAKNDYECIVHNPDCNTSKTPPVECGDGYQCLRYDDPMTGQMFDYCAPYCLVDSDCGGTQMCKPLDAPGGLGTCG